MMHYYHKIVKDPIKVYPRKWNRDGRGKLAEILRNDDRLMTDLKSWGQVYCTTVNPGITKAWHQHRHQTDRMMLLRGCMRFGGYHFDHQHVVLDMVVDSEDPCLIVIPPGVAHGFKNVGTETAFVVNIPDRVYDHKNPDELRAAPDKYPEFDWNATLDG